MTAQSIPSLWRPTRDPRRPGVLRQIRLDQLPGRQAIGIAPRCSVRAPEIVASLVFGDAAGERQREILRVVNASGLERLIPQPAGH